MVRKTSFLVSSMLGALGCGPKAPSSQSPPETNMPIRVAIQPEDRSSDVRTTPLRIVVGRQGPKLDDELTEALIGHVSLVADDGEAVPFNTKLLPTSSESSFELRLIEVIPTTTLRSTWHRLDVTVASELLAMTDTIFPGGVITSRFHPDHAPVLQRVMACPTETDWNVRVSTSEHVAFDAQPANLDAIPFAVERNGRRCRALPNYTPSGNVEPEGEETTQTFQFACPNEEAAEPTRTAGMTIRVAQVADLGSPDGATFALVPETPTLKTLELQEHDGWPVNDGCVWWFAP